MKFIKTLVESAFSSCLRCRKRIPLLYYY